MTIPGDARFIMAVGAMEDPGKSGWKLATFSSRGPTTDGRIKPDISAPGVSISAASRSTNGYTTLSGTSMAAPHLAGVAALVMSANPSLTNAQVRQLLLDTAEDRGAPGPDNDHGWGVVDPYAAVQAALGQSGSNPVKPPRVESLAGTFPVPDAWALELEGSGHPFALTILTDAQGAARRFTVTVTGPHNPVVALHQNENVRHANLNLGGALPGTYVVAVQGPQPASYSVDLSADWSGTPPVWHGAGTGLLPVPP